MAVATLVCPNDHDVLDVDGDDVVCARGHRYHRDPSTGIPTLFDPDSPPPFHVDSFDPLGRTTDEYPELGPGDLDDFVRSQVVATGGNLYRGATLTRYPQPRFPITLPYPGATVVDVGAGWGRWSLAAAGAGWNVVAVDPWIDECRAHHRIQRQLRPVGSITIVNGDGRHQVASVAIDDRDRSHRA